MRIALISYDFYPNQGGIAQNFNSFCKYFRKTGHNLYVFCPYHKGKNIFNLLDKNNYRLRDLTLLLKNKQLIYYLFLSIWSIIKDKRISFTSKLMILLNLLLKPDRLIKSLKNISYIYPYFKKFGIELVFGSHSGWSTIITIFLLSRIFNLKVISFAHGDDFLVKTLFSLKSFYLKSLDMIILSNKRTRNLIKRIHHLDDNKLHIIHYGLVLKDYEVKGSKNEIRGELNIPKNTFILLSVGRHVSRKKFDLVIKAVKEIIDKKININLKYLLIGDGPETPKLKNLTKTLNLEGNVEFLGAFGGLKRNKYYKLSDLFLMPSITEKYTIEGFGIVFLEANYFKVPVIGTATGGMIEAIRDGYTGFLIRQNNLTDLVNKILFLYDNDDKRVMMGENGHNRVINEFSWEKIINEYVKLFKSILNDKS